MRRKGFTLIELLVTMLIMGILVTISSFALQQARQNSRDSRRKADLQMIRSGLEMYRSDLNQYPPSLPAAGGSLTGGGNTYISTIPDDPSQGRDYNYRQTSSYAYELCAALEGGGPDTCVGSCGSAPCNYKVIHP